jgi:alanine racemase
VNHPGLEQLRPTWAEVDLDALTANLAAVRARVGSVPQLAVVKADAYGHGAVRVAQTLERSGVACLGVALPEEGIEIRRAGVRSPILLLGGFAPPQAELLLRHDLTPAVFRVDQLQALSGAAARRRVRAAVHLKIDTGMSRLGVTPRDAADFASRIRATPGLDLAGVFSHLAAADTPDDPFTSRQLGVFQESLQALAEIGLRPRAVHLANSAAIMDHPPTWLSLVRPGISLYGYPPSDRATALPLRPVLSLHSRIIYLREIPPGASIGYGRTYEAKKRARIATLAIGYDDGLPCRLGNRGHVLIRGRRAPIVGRVNMDLATVDVSDIPDAELGDTAVICGRSEGASLGADRLASWAETHIWDLLCGIGPRVPRLYLEGGERTVSSRFTFAGPLA